MSPPSLVPQEPVAWHEGDGFELVFPGDEVIGAAHLHEDSFSKARFPPTRLTLNDQGLAPGGFLHPSLHIAHLQHTSYPQVRLLFYV